MESVDLYKNASPWKQFKHIIGVDFSDKPIYHVEAKLYVLGTELQNKENELVTIYDATGKAVMRSDSSNISMETLEPGIYTIATTWGFFKYERCESVYQAEAKLYVSGAVLQNKNNDLVTIYDATGKAVMKSAASIISMEELPKGTYMVATIWGSFMIER
jgi:Holliday junction resolvase